MESIHVIIANRSSLIRLGLTSILYQTGYPIDITEISEYDKLKSAFQKEGRTLLIIGKAFLNSLTDSLPGIMLSKGKNIQLTIIDDDSEENRINGYYEIIGTSDTERIIYWKLEKCLKKLAHYDRVYQPSDDLSMREKEVLKLVALGRTNKEIAEILYISAHTVMSHRKNITKKLGIKTIAGLTIYAVINKLIAAEDIK
jgi:DNA-binding CsgD family transcriptional regulator